MVEPLDNKELLEAYKIYRNTIEHFDKIIGVFRQIIFTFNGVFISSGIAFYLSYLGGQFENLIKESTRAVACNKKIYAVLFMVNAILCVINLIIWLLEKHYHRYLVATASVAKHVEVELFNLDEEKRLTFQLTSCSKFSWFSLISAFIKSYDLLYLVPILGSACISQFLLNHSSLMTLFPNLAWLFPILPYAFLFCSLMLLVCNSWRESHFKLKKTESEKPSTGQEKPTSPPL